MGKFLRRFALSLMTGASLCWVPTISVQASEFFDDMQQVVGPRLQVERAQRLRLMIRQAVEGRLGPDGLGGRMTGVEIPGLGAVVSPAAAEAAGDPQFGVWADGSTTYLDSDDNGAEFDGFQSAFGTGIDYALTNAIVVGVQFNYEHSDIDNRIGNFAPGNMDTDTFGVGPYIGVALNDYLLFDASFIHSWGDTDIKDGLNSANYDSKSWNVSANLTGYVPVGGDFTLAPTVGISYSRSEDEAYTDGIFFFPKQIIYTGVFSFGATLSYLYAFDDVRSVEPSISVEGAYEFDLFGKPPLSFVASNSDEKKVDVTVTGGLDFVLSETISLSLTSSVGGLTRNEYIEISGGAQATVQF